MPDSEGRGPEPMPGGQPARARLALGLVLALSLALNAWGIGWGLPSAAGWAPDELLPSAVLDAMSRGFTGGWHDKYPPLHYYVLATLYLPVLKAAGLRAGMPVPPEVYNRLFLIGRGLSLLMAAGTLWLVYRCGRELGDRRAGLFAAAMAALMAPFAFYAKVANLDVPYLFWWALSLFFLLKALPGRGWRDLLLFTVTATLAVTTKDQAYGLYALTAPLLLLARTRARGETGPRAAASFLTEAWRAAAVACVLFAVIHNIPGNAEGFRAHLALITGRASKDFQEFPNDAGGQARLLASTVRHVVFAMGLPAFLAGILGLAEALRERATRWLLLLVPAASFYLSFLCIVLYVYDRFALPIALALAFFGGRALSRHWDDGRWPRIVARAGAALILAYGLTRVIGIDLSMTNDARYAAESWLGTHAQGGSIGAVGPAPYLPRLDGLNGRTIGPAIGRLEKLAPDFVTVNADYAARAEAGSAEHALYEGLASGSLGYREVWRHRYRAPWPLLDTAPLVERSGREPLRSNLGKVNPEILIYVRN